MFHIYVSKNAPAEIQGSKNIEGLQLRFQKDVNVNRYIIE